MAPWDADEELLEKIRSVVRKKRGANRSNAKSRCKALKRLLRRSEGNDAFENTVNTALMEFTKEGRHAEAQVLLDFEADPDYRNGGWDRDAPTLLHVAVSRGHAKMVKILMEYGASASKTSAYETPLEIACFDEKWDCLKTFLELGADPNTENWEGKSPLMLLVEEQKSLDFIELLLENGADPNFMTCGWGLENYLCVLISNSLRDGLPEDCDYAVKVVRLLLRYHFKPLCCGGEHTHSLLKLSLEYFSRLFSLAALLLERAELFEPEHECRWSRFEVLREALQSSIQSQSEAEALPLLEKANALLDRVILKPPVLRFTLRPSPGVHSDHQGVHSDHQGAELVVDTALASLQSLCGAVVRRLLLPCPLEPKIQALPLPNQIKDLLMPLNQDE